MRYYKNHFGMVVFSVISMVISFVMATAAIFVEHLEFTWPFWFKNCGTAYLIITLTGMLIPFTDMAVALCHKLGLKDGTLPFSLVEAVVATTVLNTAATFGMSAVNMYGNPNVEAAVAAGAASSVTELYIHNCLYSWPINFCISYVLAFFTTKVALKVGAAAVKAAASERGQHAHS